MIQSIRYVDFNNNTYSVKPNSFSYQPIQPLQSSSGIYSGGDPKKGIISVQDFKKLCLLSKKILDEEKLHLDKRRMITALLFIKTAEQSHRLIIGRSDLQRALETFLKELLQSS